MNEETQRVKNLMEKGVLSQVEGASLLRAMQASICPAFLSSEKVKRRKPSNGLLWGWSLFVAVVLFVVYWTVFTRSLTSPLPKLIEEIGLFPWG